MKVGNILIYINIHKKKHLPLKPNKKPTMPPDKVPFQISALPRY